MSAARRAYQTFFDLITLIIDSLLINSRHYEAPHYTVVSLLWYLLSPNICLSVQVPVLVLLTECSLV